jgi:hypothetical protein
MSSDLNKKLLDIINLPTGGERTKLVLNTTKFTNSFLRGVVDDLKQQQMSIEDILILVLDLDKMADDGKINEQYNKLI